MGTNLKSFLLCAAVIVLTVAGGAFGDWNPGDPHKMHFPQLPQLYGGWDVQILNPSPQAYNQLADDWLCTESGLIDEIHLWISWEYDSPNPITSVRVRIYADIPAAQNTLGYSTPGNCISGAGDWVFNASEGEFTVRHYGTGNQGWYDPLNNICRPNDHYNCYQINITDIVNTLSDQPNTTPVDQVQGTIYWLSFRVIREGDHKMGWKTSENHFQDIAVWNKPMGGGVYQWTRLYDCQTGECLGFAFVIDNKNMTQEYREYGDAPEGALAYPASGVNGAFPTCKNVAIANYIEHNNFGACFGPLFDFETEGNAGNCPAFNPNTYNMDECFNDGDAGLLLPQPFTIQGAVGSEAVVPCTGSNGTALGQTCATAAWGTNIDIRVQNFMPSQATGYVNVLIDWNQDGAWSGSSSCSGTAVPEHVLVNFPVPNPFDGPLSVLLPPNFQIGPNAGYVWARFSITETPVAAGWDGSGIFEDGETEDYLLLIDPTTGPRTKWSQPPVLIGTPDIYEGWDEPSHDRVPNMVADDFLCDSNDPVTAIRWWGSFLNWQGTGVPPEMPTAFRLTIWSDVPAQPADPCDPVVKWTQMPDLMTTGIDVEATEPYILADDFECRFTGKLTDITIWASWKDDWLPYGQPYDPMYGDPMAVAFTLSIHADIPASISPTGYSMPGDVLWVHNIPDHTFMGGMYAYPIEEWWMTPPMNAYFPGDTACFIYQFHINPNYAFLQQGTDTNPIVYWLDVSAKPLYSSSKFGWKTSETHWNDDAVWVQGQEPYVGNWNELRYPPQHPMYPNSIDLAFQVTTTPESEPTYSHPKKIIWENYCDSYTVSPYGWEYDPRTGYEYPKFEFYQELNPSEYWQQPNEQGIYWLGITAMYNTPTDPLYPFGWETRRHFFQDDAVRFFGVPQQGIEYPITAFEPIEWDSNSWDLSFELISNPQEPEELDFGDAPDPTYPTLLASNGASHVIVPGLMLGATIDPEADGQPFPAGSGDDNNGLIPDDEDGVTFVSKLYPGNIARIDVVVADPTGSALLNAWIDYDQSGTWDAGEAIASDIPMVNGVNKIYPFVPAAALAGTTFARFRLSTVAGLGPSGAASDGEVEDYQVIIDQLNCDWPPADPNLTKYVQLPDQSLTGIDIRVDDRDNVFRIVADDFECNSPGRITDIHLWGSWLADQKVDIQKLTIGIYNDIPAWQNPHGYYSQPGNLLWTRDFLPGQFEEKLYFKVVPGEWWWDTMNPQAIQFGDTEIWQYNICIDPLQAFWQRGTADNPIVYWLAVNADVGLGPSGPEFGWKTSVDHWNDSAVVSHDGGMTWGALGYPPNHELHGMGLTVDMAFALTVNGDCYTGPDYSEWVAVSKPSSWCFPRQCHGDANGSENGDSKAGYFWVQETDLNILIAGWKKDGKALGDYTPAIDPTGWIAADFNHRENGDSKAGYFRVQETDLNILVASWKKDAKGKGDDPAVPADCLQ